MCLWAAKGVRSHFRLSRFLYAANEHLNSFRNGLRRETLTAYHLAFCLAFCVTLFVALFLASDLAYTLTFFPWQRGKYSDHMRLTTWWLRLERVNMSI